MADAPRRDRRLLTIRRAIIGMKRRPNGLPIGQVRIPPRRDRYDLRGSSLIVTVDAAALRPQERQRGKLKRGGKEAALIERGARRVGARNDRLASGSPPTVQIVLMFGREENSVPGLTGKIDLRDPGAAARWADPFRRRARAPLSSTR
jgi:hypothetical protein